MNIAERIRTVRLPRQLGGSAESPHAAAAAQPSAPRHPAMAGLKVPPVHGHHCICQRCAPRDRAA